MAAATLWRKRIEQLQSGKLSDDETIILADDADGWNTCAVGECLGLEGHTGYRAWMKIRNHKNYTKLVKLGDAFADHVQCKRYPDALRTLEEIERLA